MTKEEAKSLKEALENHGIECDKDTIDYISHLYVVCEYDEIYPIHYDLLEHIDDEDWENDLDNLVNYIDHNVYEVINEDRKRELEEDLDELEREYDDEQRWLNSYWAETRL